jgi:hypothetical protein
MMVTHTSKHRVGNAINLLVAFTFPMIELLYIVTQGNRFFQDDALTPIPQQDEEVPNSEAGRA